MNETLQLDCFIGGARKRLAYADAVRAYWKSEYAWAIPIDHYRWDVEGHTGSAHVAELVKPMPRRFGMHLHTRSTRALTIAALSEYQAKVIEIKTFHGYAARFSKIFGDLPIELRPFFCYGVDGVGRHPVPAYRMRSSRSWCVVQGVAIGQGIDNDDVDWSPFQDPSQTAANV